MTVYMNLALIYTSSPRNDHGHSVGRIGFVSEPFLAEIRIVGFDFAPRGWAFCDGQILPINQNQSLYSLLGTTYGGDGRVSFALPDLRGCVPVHFQAPGRPLGQRGGEQTCTLGATEMPAHDHALQATTSPGAGPIPSGTVLAASPDGIYHDATNMVNMASDATGATGGGQPHENRMPYLALRFCIALQGLFPSRN